jgi:hypothetical protein
MSSFSHFSLWFHNTIHNYFYSNFSVKRKKLSISYNNGRKKKVNFIFNILGNI